VGAGKPELRAHIRHRRRSLTIRERARAADRLRDLALSRPELIAARTVAAYVSVGTEPGTGPLLSALASRGTPVLLPVLLPDAELDWAVHQPGVVFTPGPRGVLEPAGPRLGAGAVATVDVVVVPGLAVDRRGARLGRGGGSYDRALARVPSGIPVLLLLYDGEVLDHIPEEPHDRRVDVVLTPSGTLDITPARGSEHRP
jgi:5-formyltetrahydrofolate cyclo-ligase